MGMYHKSPKYVMGQANHIAHKIHRQQLDLVYKKKRWHVSENAQPSLMMWERLKSLLFIYIYIYRSFIYIDR